VWGLFVIAFVPLLLVVPGWFPMPENMASAAAAAGYNTQVAHLVAILWALIVIAMFLLMQRVGFFPAQPFTSDHPENVAGSWRQNRSRYLLELAIIAAGCILIYFPVFLAKYGPYNEDSYLLSVLQRMLGGQKPYVDFEFTYGPLMAYLCYWWTRLWGYSMFSFYSLIAVFESVQFVLLGFLLQNYYPRFRDRLLAFVLIGALCFNNLLGLNWNGIRRLLPVLTILLVASRPKANSTLVGASLILGVSLAYSHDFGLIGLVAVPVFYFLLFVLENDRLHLLRGLTIGISAVLVWFLISFLLLGNNFIPYLEASFYTLRRYSIGEHGFAFYWTVNSLALFAFFFLCCAIAGQGLARMKNFQAYTGDYLILVGLVFALLGLKSGLNRSDLWHLNAPFMVLVLAFILPLSRNIFTFPRSVQIITASLIVIIIMTYAAGLLPEGSFIAKGYVRGLRDVVLGQDAIKPEPIKTRAPSLLFERSDQPPDVLELVKYISAPSRLNSPVFPYGRLWYYDKLIGFYKTTYPTDELLLSDQAGYAVRASLINQPGTIVIMRKADYEYLFGITSYQQFAQKTHAYEPSEVKNILSWLSSIHYRESEIEALERAKRWERTIGTYVSSEYHLAAQFGDFMVLEHNQAAAIQSTLIYSD
jgi:hypothetical protein